MAFAMRGLEVEVLELVFRSATAAQRAECLREPLRHAKATGRQDLIRALLEAGADMGGSGGVAWSGDATAGLPPQSMHPWSGFAAGLPQLLRTWPGPIAGGLPHPNQVWHGPTSGLPPPMQTWCGASAAGLPQHPQRWRGPPSRLPQPAQTSAAAIDGLPQKSAGTPDASPRPTQTCSGAAAEPPQPSQSSSGAAAGLTQPKETPAEAAPGLPQQTQASPEATAGPQQPTQASSGAAAGSSQPQETKAPIGAAAAGSQPATSCGAASRPLQQPAPMSFGADAWLPQSPQPPPQRSELYLATAGGHTAKAWQLIMLGANVHAWDPWDQCSILEVAVRGRHEHITNGLLSRGADPETRCIWDRTPLHIAALKGSCGIAKALLARGANKDALCDMGESPLIKASHVGTRKIVDILVGVGCNIHIRGTGPSRYSALDRACQNGHIGILKLLLRHGAKVNSRDDRGTSAVHVAAFHGQVAALEALVGAGGSVKMRNRYGWTPLCFAASSRSHAAMLALLKHGAPVGAITAAGQSPLHAACLGPRAGLEAAARLLLEWGVDGEVLDARGRAAADLIGSTLPVDEERCSEEEAGRVRLLLGGAAAADEAWRRRCWLVMLRSRAEKAKKATKAAGGAGGGDGGGGGGGGHQSNGKGKGKARAPDSGGSAAISAENQSSTKRSKVARMEGAGADSADRSIGAQLGGEEDATGAGGGGGIGVGGGGGGVGVGGGGGSGGGDGCGGGGFSSLVGWLAGLEREGVFRAVIKFL